MSRKTSVTPSKTPPVQTPRNQPKVPEKKGFNPEDYVTMTLPLEEVKDIKQAFDIFDSDGSGSIDPQELKQAFIDLGFAGQNKFVYQILAELDEDQSGGIMFEEFVKLATAKLSDKDSRAEINKVFASFDVHKVGKISCLQLKRVAQDLGEDMTDEELQKMFAKADLDDDGFVTADDFYNIMTHRVYWDS